MPAKAGAEGAFVPGGESIKNALQEGKRGCIRPIGRKKRSTDRKNRLVQLLFDAFRQLVLVVADPLRQDIINDSPMISIAFLHTEHDAVAPVITNVNGEKRIGCIGNAAEVEFL